MEFNQEIALDWLHKKVNSQCSTYIKNAAKKNPISKKSSALHSTLPQLILFSSFLPAYLVNCPEKNTIQLYLFTQV